MKNIIMLTESEVLVATGIARRRAEWNTEHHYKDRLQTPFESGDRADVRGMCGEFAFCKLVNAWPDLDWQKPKPRDCVYAGRTVDVKCAKRPVLNVTIFEADKKHPPLHTYVAMHQVDAHRYLYLGWMFADVLFQEPPNAQGKNGPYYTRDSSELDNRLWTW